MATKQKVLEAIAKHDGASTPSFIDEPERVAIEVGGETRYIRKLGDYYLGLGREVAVTFKGSQEYKKCVELCSHNIYTRAHELANKSSEIVVLKGTWFNVTHIYKYIAKYRILYNPKFGLLDFEHSSLSIEDGEDKPYLILVAYDRNTCLLLASFDELDEDDMVGYKISFDLEEEGAFDAFDL